MSDISIFVPVIVAIITGLCGVVGQWLISKKNRKEDETRREVERALTQAKLDAIEMKVDEHNGYAKRFEEVAVSLAELRTELKNLK